MVAIDILELSKGGGCTQSSGQLVNGSKISRNSFRRLKEDQVEPFPRYGYVFSREALPKQHDKRVELFSHFEPPALFLNDACCNGNGHFGCATSYDDKGKLSRCSKSEISISCRVLRVLNLCPCTWCRLLVKLVSEKSEKTVDKKGKETEKTGVDYEWFEMTFLTRWEPDRCLMLCINTPKDMHSHLEAVLSSRSTKLDFRDPFSLYPPLMDEVVKLYDLSVWAVRNVLRPIEKKREKQKSHLNVDFSQLQEILRHSIHVGEVLAVAVATTAELRKCRKKLIPRLPEKEAHEENEGEAWKDAKDEKGMKEGKDEWEHDQVNYHLSFQTQMIQNMKFRQQSNQDRLNTEITLAYNMITQQDSKVIKGDSKAMKTVALLTMVFLPATFTSAIFSTSFFNFAPATNQQPERWSISGKMYIFWIVAAFLTVLTMIVWFLWQYREGKDFSWDTKEEPEDLEKQEKEVVTKEVVKMQKQT